MRFQRFLRGAIVEIEMWCINFRERLRHSPILRYSNALSLFWHFHDAAHALLVLEYAATGGMFKELVKCRAFDEKRAAGYIKGTALALDYCHKKHEMH